MTIFWPNDIYIREQPLSKEAIAHALYSLGEAGIAATHSSHRTELTDAIMGTPTGYVTYGEEFKVADKDAARAREIIAAVLAPY